MTENLPENFDPKQPDLPPLAVDPMPASAPEEPKETRRTAPTEADQPVHGDQ